VLLEGGQDLHPADVDEPGVRIALQGLDDVPEVDEELEHLPGRLVADGLLHELADGGLQHGDVAVEGVLDLGHLGQRVVLVGLRQERCHDVAHERAGVELDRLVLVAEGEGGGPDVDTVGEAGLGAPPELHRDEQVGSVVEGGGDGQVEGGVDAELGFDQAVR
jgi:hypothetical protein